MQIDTGIIKVIKMDENGDRAARIECRKALIPSPGKYILAENPGEPDASLGQPLFMVGLVPPLDDAGLPFLGPIPPSWSPGTTLVLRGPIGHGFRLPSAAHRLALAAFGDTAIRLLPLIHPALESGADIALFTPTSLPPGILLPPAVEVHPLAALPEALSWASFLGVDIPLGSLPKIRKALALGPHDRIPCPAYALVYTQMPCGAVADCGACAVSTRKTGYLLACKDGPVFDLHQLDW